VKNVEICLKNGWIAKILAILGLAKLLPEIKIVIIGGNEVSSNKKTVSVLKKGGTICVCVGHFIPRGAKIIDYINEGKEIVVTAHKNSGELLVKEKINTNTSFIFYVTYTKDKRD